MAGAGQFSYVVFPRQQKRRRTVDLAARVEVASPRGDGSTLLDERSAKFVAWLLSQEGLDWRILRKCPLKRRLPACLRALRVASPEAARKLLEKDPARIPQALSVMLLGVTELFRDQRVFDDLAQLLPGLLNGRAGLRVWSAGCSDGAELYSLAMLLAERNALAGSYCLGTDCRREAIGRAREGVFSASSAARMAASLRTKYLDPLGDAWKARSLLRGAIQWQVADITRLAEPGYWDIVLCRNTAMYFECEVAHALFRTLEQSLRPGGLLVVGKAERPNRGQRFDFVAPSIYRRLSNAA